MTNKIFEKNLYNVSGFRTFPDSWRPVSINQIFNLGRGRVISQEEIQSNHGIFPVYSSQTSNNGIMGFIDSYDFNTELITWTTDGANAGTIFKREGKFNCTNVCGTLRPKSPDETDLTFFKYHLGRISKNYVSYIGNPKLMNDVMGRIALPIPNIDHQRKIAKILSTADAVIEKTETAIAKYRAIKQGMMQDLFTRGIDLQTRQLRPAYKDAPHLYKETELGWIPKEWNLGKLSDSAADKHYSFTGGPFGSDLQTKDYTLAGVQIIQLQNIGDGEFINKSIVFTSQQKANDLRSCNIYPGDIIIAKMAEPVARACIIPDFTNRFLMASDGIRLSVDEKKFNNLFVKESINNNYFRSQAIAKSTGTTRERIGLTELRNIKFKYPQLKEQNLIAEKIQSVDKIILKEKANLAKHQSVKKGLMQDLLTGKVEVIV